MPEPTIIAVDWSGAKKTTAKSGIWLAVVQNGSLVHSEAAATREQAIAFVEASASPVIAGFDFSFGAPHWFAAENDCKTVDDLWRLAEREGDGWLTRPLTPPFWEYQCVVPIAQQFRRCEERLRKSSPSNPTSIFQLVGSSQVGAGSVRGMPHLARLRGVGFAVWPFDGATGRTAVEIYPSLLRKLAPHHDFDDPNGHRRDAVVSARVMWDHRESLAELTAATDPTTRIEGDVWNP